ncbi:protein of unknown function [Bradyrhizobium sp. ORS 285]|uniref:hypothetical protein n=1 Tax=Bradyrhizobium sp. ORS 285 TaxID=115808 RepID=UPI000B565201|nr:hypothetical protein [Bradyrhizobium sp. ORS 285]SMX56520.1 protein of unknown function [Bradyrhizobium sp. ORS 285]
MTTHVNKVHHVTTIAKVAKDLGEDEEWLHDVASELDIEDGVIWVYGGCLLWIRRDVSRNARRRSSTC